MDAQHAQLPTYGATPGIAVSSVKARPGRKRLSYLTAAYGCGGL